MRTHTDKIIDWLLSSLDPVSSIFHVGQYCGGGWQASTAGHAKAGFHVILVAAAGCISPMAAQACRLPKAMRRF
ncbi:hypothetical protein [Burkholderia sp. TSV86]|uniref:hypothetical protein n=1 Tax=Burkholderia sp. TSV86 TaxID=1385594 RepID=UPI0009EBFD84|nr:hypothetical protein [Burkholderia sp. TSV86]